MSDQKDIKKTNEAYSPIVPDFKPLFNKSIYEFANKKTEKLVMALYMVTDYMEGEEPLKNKIRLLSTELLSDTYKLSILSLLDRRSYLSTVVVHVSELLSFVEVAYTVGFISEMNTTILKNEFNNLLINLKSKQDEEKHFAFHLDEEMFDLKEIENYSDRQQRGDWNYKGLNEKDTLKDSLRDTTKDKRTPFNSLSFSPQSNLVGQTPTLKPHSSLASLAERKERSDKIIKIIKTQSGKGKIEGLSIKDISISFSDCSEKTIQRDLNNLVEKGQIKKTGSKRWSRYMIIKN